VARYPITRYNVSVTDSGYRLLAARYIRRQAKQLAEQFDGLRAAEDIEFVHRARVATRRLRAALRMFHGCFARKRFRRWRKAIRRTTASLGNARDRDVQIELLCGTLSALNARECFPGISRILVQFERDRERLQRKVVKAVDRLEAQGILRQMQRTTKQVVQKAAGVGQVDDLSYNVDVQTPAAYAQTGRHILRQVDELLQHQDSLANPDERERHHAMRIATKRLRYTLEIARPVYPGRLDEAVEAIKRVQSLLGDVHDCDVWAEHLDAFAAEERERITALFGHAGRFTRLQPGIDFLRADRRGHREEVFKQLVDYWAELGRRRFWDGLISVVLARGRSLVAQPPSAVPASSTQPNVASSATAAPTSTESTSRPNAPGLRSRGFTGDSPPGPQSRGVIGRSDNPTTDSVWPTARKPILTAGS
jgi:CHAD domain-containing protein